MSEYKIEKGVPIHSRLGRTPSHEFPFYSMQPGESFVCEKEKAKRCRVAASNINSRYPGAKFVTRKNPDGTMRVWCLSAVPTLTDSVIGGPTIRSALKAPGPGGQAAAIRDLSKLKAVAIEHAAKLKLAVQAEADDAAAPPNSVAEKLRKISSGGGVRRHVSR